MSTTTRVSQPAEGVEFSSAFSNFKDKAFRLELLGEYNIPEEAEQFRRFLEGAPPPEIPPHEEWLQYVRARRSEHKQIARVRGFSYPLSSYLKFETEWGYVHSIRAGEEVGALPIEEHRDLLESVPVIKDFWLFDDEHAYFVEYDFLGRFLGASKILDEFVDQYKMLAESLKRRALSFEDFLHLVRQSNESSV